ncbi:MAG: hypothetical protein BIFFINMI_02795 [Phycisphaerae bacterium]|nr:hypothetical protein [Phycisphaerae bacterium]
MTRPIASAIAAMTLACLLGPQAARAAEATSQPDAEAAIRAAVQSRRGKTELSKLAASLKPGAWVELKSDMPKGLWSSPKVDGGRNGGGAGGLHIAGWTNDAHWDSRTGQFLYMGLRQTRQFIAYSEEKNAWRVIELDRNSDNPCFRSAFGHIYGSNGLDPLRSRFYHRYNGFEDKKAGVSLKGGISYYDLLTGKWTKLPPVPPDSGFTGMAIEYFSAMDGLVILGKHDWIFSDQRQKWEDLGPSPVDGYHGLFRHNPFRHELLMAGGNNNPGVVARITREGKIERLKDLPAPMHISADRLTIDPQTGRYLFLKASDRKAGVKARMFEFDSDRNEYREVPDFAAHYPYGTYPMPVCTFIPEYGVILWAEPTGVYLYRHESSATVPIEPAKPPAGVKPE